MTTSDSIFADLFGKASQPEPEKADGPLKGHTIRLKSGSMVILRNGLTLRIQEDVLAFVEEDKR